MAELEQLAVHLRVVFDVVLLHPIVLVFASWTGQVQVAAGHRGADLGLEVDQALLPAREIAVRRHHRREVLWFVVLVASILPSCLLC